MAAALAWLLNLDAELELARPRSYVRAPAVAARIATLRSRMALLLSPTDCVLGLDAPPAGARALAFCPTPSALALIRDAGLTPPAAPSLEVLRSVNSRAFSASLEPTLEGARYVRDLAALTAALAQPSPTGVWLLKREFSFAGRERRRVIGQALDASTLGFARNTFARGQGLQVEPWLTRCDDFAQHGYLTRAGTLSIGPPLRQHCDERGTWLRSEPLEQGALDLPTQSLLRGSVERAGAALVEAGYFGPFGVDAFRYHDLQGQTRFQPRSEINARFSMGYPRALLEQALALEP